MDQKPPQSPEQPQNPAPPGQTPPPAEEHKEEAPKPESPASPAAPAATPAPASGAGEHHDGTPAAPPAGATPPAHPDAPHGKNNSMIFAVVTIVVILAIAVAGVMYMNNSSAPQAPTINQTAAQPTEAPIPTAAPTIEPSPSTPEEEVEAVNVTENDADLQEAEKDLQSL